MEDIEEDPDLKADVKDAVSRLLRKQIADIAKEDQRAENSGDDKPAASSSSGDDDDNDDSASATAASP